MPRLAAWDRDLKKDGPLSRYPLWALQPSVFGSKVRLPPRRKGEGMKTASQGGGGLCQGNTLDHTEEAGKASTPLPHPQAAPRQ